LTGDPFHLDTIGHSGGIYLKRRRGKARHTQLTVKYLKIDNGFAGPCGHDELGPGAAVGKSARGEALHRKSP